MHYLMPIAQTFPAVYVLSLNTTRMIQPWLDRQKIFYRKSNAELKI